MQMTYTRRIFEYYLLFITDSKGELEAIMTKMIDEDADDGDNLGRGKRTAKKVPRFESESEEVRGFYIRV